MRRGTKSAAATRATQRVGVVLLVLTMTSALGVGVAAAGGGSPVVVKKAWARTSPMQASNGAVYMVLKNPSRSDQVLVGASVSASVAADAQLHETVMGTTGTTMGRGMGSGTASSMTATTMAGGTGSTMTMREVAEITIPADSTVRFEPGGYHIMLMSLTQPLKTGSTVKVTLEFERGKTMTIKATVKK